MDFLDNSTEFLSVATALLLMLFSTERALKAVIATEPDDGGGHDLDMIRQPLDASSLDAECIASAALHSFRLWSCVELLGDDLGYWVKSRSTTWFSRFLLEQYAEDRWVEIFRMTKPSVFALVELLKPVIAKKDTNYRLAIPVVVRVAFTLFKLTHGASLLVCSEMFVVGRSSVSMVLREVVHAINDALRGEISWPRGEALLQIEAEFRRLCRPSGVVRSIDGTHVAISKPKFGSTDYYYFKSGGYNINCQAVVASDKRFLDLFLGMPGSTNDSRVLRHSTLYQKANNGTLWDAGVTFEGFTPYLLGDAGYPLHSWLMVPHQQQGTVAVADSLFNRRLRRGRGVVENAFAILKQTFRELLHKTELHITFVPNVITACALLHNLLLRQTSSDVHRLFSILQTEVMAAESSGDVAVAVDVSEPAVDERPGVTGLQKRRDLGVYLALQRGLQRP